MRNVFDDIFATVSIVDEFKIKQYNLKCVFKPKDLCSGYHKNIIVKMYFCFCMFWKFRWNSGHINNTLLTKPQLFFVENVFVVSNLIPFSGSHVLFGKSCLDSQHNFLAWENAKIFSFSPEMKFKDKQKINLRYS